jgi:hypothetical protein
MLIGLLVYRVDSLTYTIARALDDGGCDLLLHAITQEHVCDLDSKLLKKLGSMPRVTLSMADTVEALQNVELLIIQGHPRLLEHCSTLVTLSACAQRITVITVADRKFSRRQIISKQWREIRCYGRRLLKIDRVLYKDGFHPVDIFRFLKPRYVTGFDVHSKFLSDPDAYRMIHSVDWQSKEKRPILANFLGCRDPKRREYIVDSVRPLFFDEDGETPRRSSGKTMYWHEYSDARPSALGLTEYLNILTQSDFTLCPPGYSLITHRPLEAMLRGSIPVLNANELDLYDIGLQDGVNCVAADPDNWPSAMERLINMDENDIVGMRENIRSMIPEYLDYPASSRRMRIRLGVDE